MAQPKVPLPVPTSTKARAAVAGAAAGLGASILVRILPGAGWLLATVAGAVISWFVMDWLERHSAE